MSNKDVFAHVVTSFHEKGIKLWGEKDVVTGDYRLCWEKSKQLTYYRKQQINKHFVGITAYLFARGQYFLVKGDKKSKPFGGLEPLGKARLRCEQLQEDQDDE